MDQAESLIYQKSEEDEAHDGLKVNEFPDELNEGLWIIFMILS